MIVKNAVLHTSLAIVWFAYFGLYLIGFDGPSPPPVVNLLLLPFLLGIVIGLVLDGPVFRTVTSILWTILLATSAILAAFWGKNDPVAGRGFLVMFALVPVVPLLFGVVVASALSRSAGAEH